MEQAGGLSRRTRIILAFAAVYIIWGSTYLAIRFAIETLPPFLMAGTRFITAGLILTTWMLARGEAWPAWREWRTTFLVGVGLITIGNGAVVWAELRIPSGIAALIVAVMPCWMVLLDWVWGERRRPTLQTALGLLLGFGGIALLIGPGFASGGDIDITGVLAVLLATIAWPIGSIYSKLAPMPKSKVLASGMQMLLGGLALGIVALVTGEVSAINLDAVSTRSILSAIYLTIFGSLVAYSAFVFLLQEVPAPQVATYAYVNPVVAVLLGWAFAGELLSGRMVVAAAVIIAGVALITMSAGRAESRTTDGMANAKVAGEG